MAWRDLVDTMRMAAADAERAGRLYQDPAFRAGLRTAPEETLRRFGMYALAQPRPALQPVRVRRAIAA